VLPRLDLVLQGVALGTARDVDQRRRPVEGREHLVLDRLRLDVPGPPDDERRAIAAFPGLPLLALERRDTAVWETDRFGAVVGGEDEEGVVELTHVLELLDDIA